MTLTLQQLFVDHFRDLASRHHLSADMHYAAWCVMNCRTRTLGGHSNACPEGHYFSIAYNSCGHRCCPKCGWLDKEKWLAGIKRRLLPVPHHHVVFTVASELVELWRFNRGEFARLLFDAASQTLIELLADTKYLGARPGILAALHTWNQQLQPHVHLHCVVTAGGLTEDGRWVSPRRSCLLPRKVLMIKFRGKFKALLRARVREGRMTVPDTVDLEHLLRKVSGKPWNVKIHDAYRHGEGVAKYLASYLKRGPIRNGRLLAVQEGCVIYRHRLSGRLGGDGRRQVTGQLPVDTFLLRWLQHVPPRGLHTVRGYGLYSGNQHSQHSEACLALGQEPPEPPEHLTWHDFCEEAGFADRCCCPICGRRLIEFRTIAPQRAPPPIPVGCPRKVAHDARQS